MLQIMYSFELRERVVKRGDCSVAVLSTVDYREEFSKRFSF